MKKFEVLAMPAPSWYSDTRFNNRHFYSFTNRTMHTARRSMTSSPSRSGSRGSGGGTSGRGSDGRSSGRSSGGGSSGRGSGGGGGSSW